MFHPRGPTFLEQARQCLSSTREGYDLLAPKFEYTPYRTPDELLAAVAEILRNGPPFAAALDVCCGTGAGMRMLRPLAGEKVVGIDFSSEMLAQARKLGEGSPGGADLEFVQGDVLEMSFHGEFDVATCFGALGHIVGDDTAPFLRRVHDSLKPGGRFVFISGEHPPLFSLSFWLSHGFNLAMRIRNFLIKPEFVMYFLTFLLPEIEQTLREAGFEVEVASPEKLGRHRVVIATKMA